MSDAPVQDREIIQIVEHIDYKNDQKKDVPTKKHSLFAKQFKKDIVLNQMGFPQPYKVSEDAKLPEQKEAKASAISEESNKMLSQMSESERIKEIEELRTKLSSNLRDKLKKIKVKDEYLLPSTNIDDEVDNKEEADVESKDHSIDQCIILLRSSYGPQFKLGVTEISQNISTMNKNQYTNILQCLPVNYSTRSPEIKLEVLTLINKIACMEYKEFNTQIYTLKKNYIPHSKLCDCAIGETIVSISKDIMQDATNDIDKKAIPSSLIQYYVQQLIIFYTYLLYAGAQQDLLSVLT